MSPVLSTFGNFTVSAFGFGKGGKADFELIQTQTTASAVASVTFTGIPTVYRHLLIRGAYLINGTVRVAVRLNGDTGSNYSWHTMDGNGLNNTVSTANNFTTNMIQGGFTTNRFVANTNSPLLVEILDYQQAKNKTVTTFTGYQDDTSGSRIAVGTGLWNSTAAVTSVTVLASTGNIVADSRFSLYGIRG
jgi:hypothetical protein